MILSVPSEKMKLSYPSPYTHLTLNLISGLELTRASGRPLMLKFSTVITFNSLLPRGIFMLSAHFDFMATCFFLAIDFLSRGKFTGEVVSVLIKSFSVRSYISSHPLERSGLSALLVNCACLDHYDGSTWFEEFTKTQSKK